VAERAGVSLELARTVNRISGFADPAPDARDFSEAHVEMLRIFDAGEQLLGRDVILQLGRVIGSAMARVADAAISMFVVRASEPLRAQDPAGLAVAKMNVDAVAMIPAAVQAMDVLLRSHMLQLRRPLRDDPRESRDYETQRLAVSFADLVGSTAFARELSIGELGAAISEFEGEAFDRVAAAGGRLVKFIGDEAMFVFADPARACDVALDLIAWVQRHAVLPALRVGIADGEVLMSGGDCYGPVVNLAARAVKLAAPNDVVVPIGVLDRLPAGLVVTSIGAGPLKGIDEPVELFTVARA
jgi:class 3 adenylate cyclase